MRPRIVFCKDKKEFAKESGDFIRDLSAECIKKRGGFTIMLPGGRTPEIVFDYLATPEIQRSIEWNSIYIFWGDERYVPADHSDSNYHMAYRSLLSKAPIPGKNIFRVPTEESTVEDAADVYEKTIKKFFFKKFFLKDLDQGSFPAFDLALLGMGSDGHTASLYPGNEALKEDKRWVISVQAPETAPVKKRISVTLPLINSSRHVCFLITGTDKIETMREVLKEGELKEKKIPAAMVDPKENITWFTDNSEKDILLY
jgi:6-phosphogluconolactonase